MTRLYPTCVTAEVLGMQIHHLDDRISDCDMPAQWDWFSAMHYERYNLISRWQEITGESWPDLTA
jgi:hypothetical protein